MCFRKEEPTAKWILRTVAHFLPLASLAAASSASLWVADLAFAPVQRSKLWWASPTRLISFLAASSLIKLRATDPFTLNFSQRTPRVMQRILGASVKILSYFFCSRKTSLLSLSLTLTFPHFFVVFFVPLVLAA